MLKIMALLTQYHSNQCIKELYFISLYFYAILFCLIIVYVISLLYLLYFTLSDNMQPKFSSDEKVLCYHGPLLYEAKILKHKKEGGSYNYFVHYQVLFGIIFFFLTKSNVSILGLE